ncbi:unnamed protein product [Oncorhynchus mykiss]|uniref:Rab effector MyRIP/Melanophilin domain-containing protein n=1 Tax=Oncorhynchus mykiss TaxID=8022 RepID=A0A060WQN2_ONCMY|nr:unnamed protein product [Oncorhynchus mykiss]
MAETLTVALRVAEEAIDEAIAKAEGHTDSQDKQSEARYLRDHREELIEELATTIVQKIIRRRKNLAEMKPDYDLDWLPDNQSGDLPLASSSPSCKISRTTSARAKASIWRSHSAFSLLDDNVMMQCSGVSQDSQHGLKKEGGAAGLANWKSVDRLDNSSASSVLKSPDGNWIAQQSTQLSRPSLLTKRKSLVFSVLEKESGVISAYDEMGSDDAEGGEGAWGAALLEIRRKMTNANNNQGSEAPDSQASDDQQHSLPSPLLDHHASTDTLNSESEVGEDPIRGQGPKPQKPLLAILKRKVPVEHRCTPSSRRSSRPGIFDVNFNPEGTEAESSGADELEEGGKVRRTRRRKRTKKDQGEGRGEEYSSMILDALAKKLSVKKTSQSGAVTPDTLTLDGGLTSRSLTPEPRGGTMGVTINLEQELTIRLRELASQVRGTEFSSTEDELDRVNDAQLSSTEDEQDRVGLYDEEMEKGREERGGEGGGEREEIDAEALWEMEGDKEQLTSKLRDLASLVSASQFSSTEDELDRVGRNEGEREEGRKGDRMKLSNRMEGERRRVQVERVREKPWYLGGMEVEGRRMNKERRDSIGELDVRLFDFEDESEKEGELQSEEMDTKVEEEGVMKVQRMMERMFEGGKEGKRAGEAERKVEGGMGEAAVGERERETTESVDTVEGEVMFDKIISNLEDTLGGMEVEIDGEMAGGKERERDSSDKTVECVVKRGEKEAREKDEQAETETHKSIRPQHLDERKEQVSDQTKSETSRDLEEESKGVERGGYEGGEVEEQTSEKEMDDFGEREGENFEKNTDEKETESNRTKDPEESAPCVQEEILSSVEIQNRYSAMSLRSITTEVLTVLNATEDLLQGVEEGDYAFSPPYTPSLPLNTDTKRLDEQLSRLEENVYVAAGTAYGLEAELDDLEECARAIGDSTSDLELSYLEEQVASAAAQVHQSDLQVSDIAARITALKNAGLNVVPQNRFTKPKKQPKSSNLWLIIVLLQTDLSM